MALPPRRPRTVAVRISQQEYFESLQMFRGNRPPGAAIGGIYVDETWKTTPTMLTALFPLLQLFIEKGLSNCAVYPSMLDASLQDLVRTPEDHPSVESPLLFIAQVRDHIAKVFAFVRLYKMEENQPLAQASSGSTRWRKFPKTAAFRRQMSNADSIIMQSLTTRIEISNERNEQPRPSETESIPPLSARSALSAGSALSEPLSARGGPSETEDHSIVLSQNDVFKKGLMLLDRDFPDGFGEFPPAASAEPTLGALPPPPSDRRNALAETDSLPPLGAASDTESFPPTQSYKDEELLPIDKKYDQDGILLQPGSHVPTREAKRAGTSRIPAPKRPWSASVLCPRAQERKAASLAGRKTKGQGKGKGGPVAKAAKVRGKGVPKNKQRLPSRERPRPDAPWDAKGFPRAGSAYFVPSGEVPGSVIGTFRKDKSDAKAKAKTMLSATTQQWTHFGMAQAEADGKRWAKAKRDEKAKAKAEAELASRPVSRGKAKAKAKAEGKDGPAAKTLEAEPEVNPDWLLPMDKPKLAGPTQEASPRCELTAFITADGTRRRMHVMTSTLTSWAPR